MTRNTSFFVGVTALLAVGYPACADEPDDWDGWNGYAHAQARLAQIQQRRATYLPRRYQTANAFDAAMGPGMRTGAAWLIRSKNGIQGRIMSNVSTYADPYTLWIVIFNEPSACDGPCDGTDLANPAVGGSVFNGTGAISAANGNGGGVFNVDFEIVAGNLPNDLFILLGDAAGLHHNNGFGAEIHLVIDRHPSIAMGPDSWIVDLTQTNFPGEGPAVSEVAAVFVACPDASCPPSVL